MADRFLGAAGEDVFLRSGETRTAQDFLTYGSLARLLKQKDFLTFLEKSSFGKTNSSFSGPLRTDSQNSSNSADGKITVGTRIGLLFTENGSNASGNGSGMQSPQPGSPKSCNNSPKSRTGSSGNGISPGDELSNLMITMLSVICSEIGNVTLCPINATSKVPKSEVKRSIGLFSCDALIVLESALNSHLDLTKLRDATGIFVLKPTSLRNLNSENSKLSFYEVRDHRDLPPSPEDEGGPLISTAADAAKKRCECKLLLTTSGTTGTEKLVPYSTKKLVRAGQGIAKALKLTKTDVCLNAMPLFHIGGISSNLLAVMVSGGSLYSTTGFDPHRCADLVFKGGPKPTWYYMVPTMHRAMMFALLTGGQNLTHNLRFVRSASAHLLAEDAVNLWELFNSTLVSERKTPCLVLSTYGMTEAMPICSPVWTSSPKEAEEMIRSSTVGIPCSGVEIMIAEIEEDDEKRVNMDPVPKAVPSSTNSTKNSSAGEICVRGETVMIGYIAHTCGSSNGNAEYEVKGLTPSGWFRTGDLGRQDPSVCGSGKLYMQGRIREMLKRGGEQVNLHSLDLDVRKQLGQFLSDLGLLGDEAISITTFASPSAIYGEEPSCVISFDDPDAVSTLGTILQREYLRVLGSTSRDQRQPQADLTGATLVAAMNSMCSRIVTDYLNRDLPEYKKIKRIFVYANKRRETKPAGNPTSPKTATREGSRNLPKTATGKWQRHKMHAWFVQNTSKNIAENQNGIWCPYPGQAGLGINPALTIGATPVVGVPTQATAEKFFDKSSESTLMPLIYCGYDPSNVTRMEIMEKVTTLVLLKYVSAVSDGTNPESQNSTKTVLVQNASHPLVYHHNSLATILGMSPQDFMDRMLIRGTEITVDLANQTVVKVENSQLTQGQQIARRIGGQPADPVGQQGVNQPGMVQRGVVQQAVIQQTMGEQTNQQAYEIGNATVTQSRGIQPYAGPNPAIPNPANRIQGVQPPSPYHVQYHAFTRPTAPITEREVPIRRTGSTGSTVPLRVLRFFLAIWVIQLHVGRRPNIWLAKTQSFSMDMPAFSFLAAFLLAKTTANSQGISKAQRRNFYITRIGMAHGVMLVSLLFALPIFLIRCGPGQCGLPPQKPPGRDPNEKHDEKNGKDDASGTTQENAEKENPKRWLSNRFSNEAGLDNDFSSVEDLETANVKNAWSTTRALIETALSEVSNMVIESADSIWNGAFLKNDSYYTASRYDSILALNDIIGIGNDHLLSENAENSSLIKTRELSLNELRDKWKDGGKKSVEHETEKEYNQWKGEVREWVQKLHKSHEKEEEDDKEPDSGSFIRYLVRLIMNIVLQASGFWPTVFLTQINPVCWYQSNYYCFLLAYPFFDSFVREQTTDKVYYMNPATEVPREILSELSPADLNSTRFYRKESNPTKICQWACISGGVATICMIALAIMFGGLVMLFQFTFVSWIPLFVAGMCAWRLHEYYFLPRIIEHEQASVRNVNLSQEPRDVELRPINGDPAVTPAWDRNANFVPNTTTDTNNGRHYSHRRWYTSPALWGLVTDGVSLFFIFMMYLNYVDPCVSLPKGGEKCFPDATWAEYNYESNKNAKTVNGMAQKEGGGPWNDGRWNSRVQAFFCFLRFHTPYLIIWILGLAGIGYRSLTYKLFNVDTIATKLSSLAYPMYLTHYNVAWYYWWITRGFTDERDWYQHGWWYDKAAGYPWPVETWEVLIIIASTIWVAHIVDSISGKFVHLGQQCISCQIWCIQDMCCRNFQMCPKDGADNADRITSLQASLLENETSSVAEGTGSMTAGVGAPIAAGQIGIGGIRDGSRGSSNPTSTSDGMQVFQKLSKLIREMSGAIVSMNTNLDEIGLDSFGLPAFVGMLKTRFPEKHIALNRIAAMRKVSEIVQYLESSGPENLPE